MEYYRIFLLLIIIINSFIFASAQNLENNDKFEKLIDNYYSYPSDENNVIDINLDHFVTGYLNHTSTNYYKVFLSNDSEQIFFDFQSEYGCLYINIDNELLIKDLSEDFIFCSNGANDIFTLDKKEINEKMKREATSSIEGLNMTIAVSSPSSELNSDFGFYYSLKVSLKKSEINIFEINSSHKMLCKTEKINEIYRCVFILVNNDDNNEQNDRNLIIYSKSMKSSIKLNIFADYINKSEYDNWNTTYLSNNIPNNNSLYNNSDMEIINIPNLESDKYIYISVESSNETIIEIMNSIVSNEDEVKLPKLNDIQIYSINKTSILDFNDLSKNETNDISLSIVTIYGKANIIFENDETIEYLTDTIENQLIFNIDINKCINDNKCKLTINNLEDNNETDYIFYISYTMKTKNVLKELTCGKSSKLLYNNYDYLILYQELQNILSPININLQLYKIEGLNLVENNPFNIEIRIISKKDLYNIKVDNSQITKFTRKIEGNFDNIYLGSNIYLTVEDIINFDVFDNPYLIIYVNNTNNYNKSLVLGTTISQMNDLMYPSERIYHYGQLKDKQKIVYKLKGKTKYHLMRLEFASNSGSIGWSVKRTNESENYKQNDTYLSFVTEKWINGRELITMYIERGEDIYLTIFKNDLIQNEDLTYYIFKYINSAKNGDFRNYYTKNDILTYNIGPQNIEISKIKNIPASANINYYLKIFPNDNYIQNEGINTIAFIKSNYFKLITGEKNEHNNSIIFNIKNILESEKTYYLNVYSVIIENNYNFEFASYSGLTIEGKTIEPVNINLIWSSFGIAGLTFIMIIIASIRFYYKEYVY